MYSTFHWLYTTKLVSIKVFTNVHFRLKPLKKIKKKIVHKIINSLIARHSDGVTVISKKYIEFFLRLRSLSIWNSKNHPRKEFFLLNHKSCTVRLKSSGYDLNFTSDRQTLNDYHNL